MTKHPRRTDLDHLTRLTLPRTCYVVASYYGTIRHPGIGIAEMGFESRDAAFDAASEEWGEGRPTRVIEIDMDEANMPEAVRDITEDMLDEWAATAPGYVLDNIAAE